MNTKRLAELFRQSAKQDPHQAAVRLFSILSGQHARGRVRHLYFIQSGDTGPVKIGSARDVKCRLGELQIGNHEQLRIVLVIRGAADYESVAHAVFDHLRIRGEWFECTGELQMLLVDLLETRAAAA